MTGATETPTLRSPTRADYMAGRCTFAQFYGAVLATAGIAFRPDSEIVGRTRKALAAGDEHLNTIPLGEWDRMSEARVAVLNTALKQHGDFYSLGSGVCCMKEAARLAAIA